MFAQRGYHGTAVPEVAQAANVATGTLYHYFDDKQQLVNEVFRDAKLRLRAALLDGVPDPQPEEPGSVEAWFLDLWHRLAAFARREPETFRFLEMQDHVEYLDAESRAVEMSVLAPVFMTAKRVGDRAAVPRVDVVIALMWGAFVGLAKADRLGYLKITDDALAEAGAVAWRMFAPEAERAARRDRARR